MSVNVSTSSVDRSHMNFGRVKQQGTRKEKIKRTTKRRISKDDGEMKVIRMDREKNWH